MQALLDPPRDALNYDEIVRLIETEDLHLVPGLEVLNPDLTVDRDVSDQLQRWRVKHNNFADIHSQLEFEIEGALEWGKARVRPYVTISGLVSAQHRISARFNLGAYITPTPERVLGQTPEVFKVEGQDLLKILARPAAATFAAAPGTIVTQRVEALLTEWGAGTPFYIPASDEQLATAFVRPFDEDTTYLHLINGLLDRIGYRGLYVDQDGRFRSEPYQSPREKAPEWTYSTDSPTSIVGVERNIKADLFDAPNRWVVALDNAEVGIAEPGNEFWFEEINQSEGATSVDARGGMIINSPHLVDATSAAAFQALARQIVDREKPLDVLIDMTVPRPNPVHWHADVLMFEDPAFGGPLKCSVHEWELDSEGGPMKISLRKVA